MFRERIGVWFGREMLSLMSGNLWFYSTRGAILAVALISKLGLHSLYRKYRVVQEQIIADIYRETGIHLHASDALLLANLSETEAIQLSPEQRKLLAEFKRGKGYRICLTPRFELAEQR